MKKKLLSILLVGAMVATTFAGCGGAATEEETPASTPAADAGSADAGDDAATADAGEEAAPKFERFDELQEITIKCMDIIPSDNTARDAAINAISEEVLNVHVTIEQTDIVSYMTQLPLALSSGEKFDLVMTSPIPACGFTTMQAQGQLMDITDYMDEYASDAKSIIGDMLQSTTVDGRVYGIPTYRQVDSSIYLMMREDVLEKAGLVDKARAATTWAEIEEIFATVQPMLGDFGIADVFGPTDNQGTMLTPGETIICGDNFSDAISYDSLGDTYKVIVTDFDTNKIINRYETEEYKSCIDRLLKWYDNGWVRKSALTDQDNSGDAGFQNSMYFAFLSTGEYGQEINKEASTQQPIVAIEISKIPIATQSGRQWGWAVSSTSENPEAAVAFINLCYTNADIVNLFCWGIEGDDYNVVDGEAVVNYGKENVYMSGDFLYFNQFIAYPKQGMGAGFRDEAKANMANHPMSPYFGISVDSTAVSDEITNVKTVLDQYQLPLEAGQNVISVEDLSAKCLSAGLDKIIEFYQETVDAFVAQ